MNLLVEAKMKDELMWESLGVESSYEVLKRLVILRRGDLKYR